MWILHILIFNLIIVLALEITFAAFLGARSFKNIATVALVNIITNPAAVLCSLCLTVFFSKWRIAGIIFIETAVFFTEGFMFSKFKTFGRKNPYIISLLLNLLSFATGEIINIFL